MYNLDENDDFDRELIATYEEVAKLYPRPGVYRPIVLIGSPGIGRNELKRRLIARDPEKYRSPIPCECCVLHLPTHIGAHIMQPHSNVCPICPFGCLFV